MRLPFALLLLFPFLAHALRAAEPAPLRAALLAWEPVPARPDVQRVAADLLALAQAELSAEPGLAWVERAELDKLLAEADLAVSGRLDPRASLRLGKLARAQLLVTGRLDASDPAATTLVLEAIDLDRGDLLATAATPLPPRLHRHYAVRDADLSVSKSSLQGLLAQAAARHRELSARPAVALLFLANSGPSSRLDAAGERLADALRASAASAGARVLRFPRARDAEAEQDLAILGLAEADDQTWRGVADSYVWGEYKELPADGLAFADTPVEASLTLWDGATAPRTIPWSGTVATFPAAAEAFAAALRPAVRPATASDPAARSTAAGSLLAQDAALEKLHRPSLEKPEFWKSELGRNVHRQRIQLLETAAFLDPGAPKPRRLLHDVRWHRLAAPAGGYSADQLWRRYADLRSLPEDPITRRSPGFHGHEAHRRVAVLEDIMRAHGKHLRGEGRLEHSRIVRAAELWVREVNTHFAVVSTEDAPFGLAGDFLLRECLQTVTGEGPLVQPSVDPSVVGNQVLHILIDGAWPALAPAFAEQYKSDRETAEVSAARILEVFQSVGREDIAHARFVAALDPAQKTTAQHPGPADRMREFEQLTAGVAEITATLPVRLVQVRLWNQGGALSIEFVAPFGTPAAECARLADDFRRRILAASLGITSASVSITPDPKAPPRIEASGMPADPPVVAARWGVPDAPAAVTPTPPPSDFAAYPDLSRALPLGARPLHAWMFAGDFPSDLFARAYQQWPPRWRLTPPDHTRLLGFDGTHLWIEGLPIEGALNKESAPYRLTAYSPYARTFHGLSPRLPSGSRFIAAHFDARTAYLATEFDGLVKLGPAPAAVLPVTPDDGLPSLKLSSLAHFANGIAVAAAPPENAAAYLDSATGQWRALRPPAPVLPSTRSASHPATSRAAASGATGPRLAGAGPWLLYADAQPQLYNTSTERWSDALAQYQSSRSALHDRVSAHVLESIEAASARGDTAEVQTLLARRREIPDWALQTPQAVLGDGDVFWLGGPYGLVRLDPSDPARAQVEKCPPILALADAGPWLWVAFAPPADSLPPSQPGNSFSPDSHPPHAAPYPHDEAPEWRRSRLALYDKASRRWLGSVEVAGGILSLAAAPGRLWAAGSDLYEFDTTTLLPPPPAPDPGFATSWAALPDHALHRAATLHDHATLSARLSADPASARDTSASGWTPLHAAAAARNDTALDLLLSVGPPGATDVNAFTAEGVSPLALAAAAGHPPAIVRLVAAGADPSGQHNPPPPPPLTEFGEHKGALPSVSPPQPVTADAELLPAGTIRISWKLAPGPYDGFIIYRRDLDRLRREGAATRWNVSGADNDAKWDYLGDVVTTAGPDTRSWTDLDLRFAAINYRYTVVAVNPHDRFGPRTPTAAVTVHAPALAAPPARLYAASPARFSPSPLHLAAAAGQTEAVAALLDAGADPAARDQGGYTPHHAALLAGHLAPARVLLARGAPVNARVPRPARDSLGAATVQSFQRPFHPALPGLRPVRGAGTALSLIYEGDTDRELLETLLASGADPLLGPDGPLVVRAAFLGRADDVERFLALAPHPFVTDIYGRTAFAAALAARRFTLALALRERCFAPDDPRWPTDRAEDLSRNALTLAVGEKDPEMLAWLRERGATASRSTWGDLLKIAVEQEHVENARLLLAAGARPSDVPGEKRKTVNSPELVALLAGESPASSPALAATAARPSPPAAPGQPAARPPSAGPAPTPFLYPRQQYSRGGLYSPPPDNIWIPSSITVAQKTLDDALLAAAARGDIDALRSALAAGARVDAADAALWTPLIHAIKGGHLTAARTLIDRGASLNRLTARGSTPLGFACELPDLAFARELLDLGADPNLVDPRLPNALPLVASMTKNPAATRLMLERGADPRVIVSSHGRGGALPPVFLAAARGDMRSVALLVAAGADPTTVLWRDGKGANRLRGQTALHSAAVSDDLATLEYFLSLGLDPAQTEAYGDNPLDMALLSDARRTAAHLRKLGLKTRAERGLPPRDS